jgi:hypothetical protein
VLRVVLGTCKKNHGGFSATSILVCLDSDSLYLAFYLYVSGRSVPAGSDVTMLWKVFSFLLLRFLLLADRSIAGSLGEEKDKTTLYIYSFVLCDTIFP